MRAATAQLRVHRRGLGMVEAMIALAITAALLTAVGSAFAAASKAITENDEFFQATHTGRVALARMVTQVRRGSVDNTSTATSLHLITDTGADLTYTYVAATRTLNLITHTNGVDTTHRLARNVENCEFFYETGNNYAGTPCVTRVAVAITVKVDNNQVLLSGTGASRSTLAF